MRGCAHACGRPALTGTTLLLEPRWLPPAPVTDANSRRIVRIRIDDNTVFSVSVPFPGSVRNIKANILGCTCIPIAHQRLIFMGTELEDDLTLQDHPLDNMRNDWQMCISLQPRWRPAQ